MTYHHGNHFLLNFFLIFICSLQACINPWLPIWCHIAMETGRSETGLLTTPPHTRQLGSCILWRWTRQRAGSSLRTLLGPWRESLEDAPPFVAPRRQSWRCHQGQQQRGCRVGELEGERMRASKSEISSFHYPFTSSLLLPFFLPPHLPSSFPLLQGPPPL